MVAILLPPMMRAQERKQRARALLMAVAGDVAVMYQSLGSVQACAATYRDDIPIVGSFESIFCALRIEGVDEIAEKMSMNIDVDQTLTRSLQHVVMAGRAYNGFLSVHPKESIDRPGWQAYFQQLDRHYDLMKIYVEQVLAFYQSPAED